MLAAQRTPIFLPPAQGRRLSVIGHHITVKLTCAETAGSAYVFEDFCPPGIGVPPHVHRNEDEIVTVLEGEFEIFLGGQTYAAAAGAVVNFPRGVPHAFHNRGSRPARALFTVTPAESFEQFFEELSALPPAVPPDPAHIAAIFGRYGMEILPSAQA